ncbi:hypothetical protein [Microvirga sp. M2]|uniref:hypothetical protein n=1 Tax=Microvirga sp. M2 TaxID=3073270 RepID=UPI0039C423B4
MHNPPIRGIRFGFSAPDDQVVSLNVPAESDDGLEHPHYSFDIEYDPEHPDRVTLRLLELDQDAFIRTIWKSISFPVALLSDLIGKRTATPEEVAEWQTASDEDE